VNPMRAASGSIGEDEQAGTDRSDAQGAGTFMITSGVVAAPALATSPACHRDETQRMTTCRGPGRDPDHLVTAGFVLLRTTCHRPTLSCPQITESCCEPTGVEHDRPGHEPARPTEILPATQNFSGTCFNGRSGSTYP
jgi:hypothetical protein